MVGVGAVAQRGMHIDLSAHRQSQQELAYQGDVEITRCRLRVARFVVQIGAAADIDYDLRQGVIHRHDGAGETYHRRGAARLAQTITEHQPHVLDQVVRIDLDIATSADRQCEAAVKRHRFQHVAEERYRRIDTHTAGVIERDPRRDLRFVGAPFDARAAPLVDCHLRSPTYQ